MKNKYGLTPIKIVFKIIDSCINEKQLKSCIKLSEHYTQMIKKKGVINSEIILEKLIIRINEKRQELRLSNRFRGRIKRRKIKIEEVENILAENFV